MICERCGEVGETFMTEKHGELCEGCQRLLEQEQPGAPRTGQGRPGSGRPGLGPSEA